MSARERLIVRVEEAIEPRLGAFDKSSPAERAVDTMFSFDGLMALAEQWLDEHYPADVRLICDADSPDPGPRLVAALRDCLRVRS